MSELKHCPVCKGTGKIEKVYTILDTVPIKWTVICCDCRFMTDIKGTKAAAKREWNRRAEYNSNGIPVCGFPESPKEEKE